MGSRDPEVVRSGQLVDGSVIGACGPHQPQPEEARYMDGQSTTS